MSGAPGLDPRRRHGIYPTPRFLVGYVLRSVHGLLQDRFGLAAGLADPAVRLLDPAAGPLRFVLAAWRLAVAEHRRRGGSGIAGTAGMAALARDHLVPHFASYELLAAEHARGLAAASRFLSSLGCLSGEGQPGPWLLADAFSVEAPAPPGRGAGAPFSQPGGEEGGTVLVVVGNPPWRGGSAGGGPWIDGLLQGYRLPDGREEEGYFQVEGRPLCERNMKWLQDDYVRFLRLAQWRLDRAGQGIAALVVNHNCLEAPTFRGLRRSLLGTFDEVHALDLHGNVRKRETAPGGGRDENVFPGVAQGAAVLLLVKRAGLRRRVLRADLHGLRRAKLRALSHTSAATTGWTEVRPRPPLFLFAATDERAERDFRRGLCLTEVFPLHATGIVTGRDALATGLDRWAVEHRLAALRAGEGGAAAGSPGLAGPRRRLLADGRWRRRLTSFLARPFDLREVFYADYLLARPRRAVMRHLAEEGNVALLATRQSSGAPGALVTRWIAGHKAIDPYAVSSVFPLYLGAGPDRAPNLAPGLLCRLGELYGRAPAPEEVLGYAYGLLHSPRYRSRFREPLGRHFPRLLFPRSQVAFTRLAAAGLALVRLHLLSDPRLAQGRARIVGDPSGPPGAVRSAVRFLPAEARVELDDGRLSLVGIEPATWEHRVGGYRVLERWLEARAGRALSPEERRHLCRVAEAIRCTVAAEAMLAELGAAGEENAARLPPGGRAC